uniref:2'-phosphotransferase n=1 Tax=Alexandrium monilatum TaxID=311494 RepID=A0A7S4W4Y7_9DINO|mmetsp:Transcript_17389/g.54405  ORF Transcript_17389/g.54405 Transcript_17389/m.54405 type:complete len:454 (-) Transcript_17389:70-1431(-)
MPRRSRSPLRATPSSERISRQLAAFGRYPDKRPAGLRVDASGAFLLEDLMRAWGRQEGLKEQDVLDAVRRHLLHDSGGSTGGSSSALRFSVDADKSGRISIRVMPKKATGEPPVLAAPPAGAGKPAAPCRPPPQLTVRSLHGSVLQQVAAAQDAVRPKAAPDALKSGFIAVDAPEAPDDTSRMDVDPGPSIDDQRANVERACKQMGLTAETQHLRQTTPGSAKGDGARSYDGGRSWGRRSCRGDGRPAGEQVQRWLSWALRHGHRELMLSVDVAGWAELHAIARAMRRSRPDFGEFDARRLQALLEETDVVGRFEVAGGKLRKLARDHRQPRPDRCAQPAPAAPSAASGGIWGLPVDSHRRGRSGSSSSSIRSVRRRGSPSRSPSPAAALPANGAHLARQPQASGTGMPPPPPPGDEWTKYQDNGKDWYYYEGPLGRWWCESGSDEVQPYDEE